MPVVAAALFALIDPRKNSSLLHCGLAQPLTLRWTRRKLMTVAAGFFLHAVTFILILLVSQLAPAWAERGEQLFSAKLAARSLAAAPINVSRPASWHEAEELSAEEATALAAVWDTLALSSGLSNENTPIDPHLVGGKKERTNTGRSSLSQSGPGVPDLTGATDSGRRQRPRYRVVGEGEAGSAYELAEALDHDPADDISDLVMLGDGLKRNATTTTTSTPSPILHFRQCADASTRGYAMPFSCCSVRNGDFYDKQTWHCGRIPTSLDAVFIRHFVRIPASRSKLELRALWLVRSLDPQFEGKVGVLRSGQLPGGRCSAESAALRSPAAVTYSVEELSVWREILGGLLNNSIQAGKMSLSDLCGRLRATPFSDEEDFKIEKPTAVIIRDPGSGPLGPTVADIAYTGTTEALEADRERHEEESLSIVNRQVQVETNLPETTSENVTRDGSGDEGKLQSKVRTGKRERFGDDVERNGHVRHEADESVTSPIVPFDFGRTFHPVAGFATRLPPASPSPYISPRARGLSVGRLSRRRKFAEPLSLKGPATLRVEPGAALLLLSGVTVVTDAPIRNDGVLFMGEVLISEKECHQRRPPSHQGMCRIPSLSSGGSLIAKRPVHIHWLQLSSSWEENAEPAAWYGRIGYPPALPASSFSTLTFFGHVKAERILPGTSFSFSRVGFPPFPPPPQHPQKTSLEVTKPKDSVDLIIYVDLIDDDGFIDCCEDFYDREPAIFDLSGVDLMLGPYSKRRKDIGDQGKISEQVVLRANRITTEETFVGLPALIPPEDAKTVLFTLCFP